VRGAVPFVLAGVLAAMNPDRGRGARRIRHGDRPSALVPVYRASAMLPDA